ncbi:predicted protein [Plenodomus lingam JN3]|uniref:Predicted protein n=1 Tax=Leptosphaeria maculans (strain JN3 / isolate v23.1.3 / race Av1-4-5-6-7-8) TaxID=985895 RepID=E4ZXP9_LEPMJ|nr:predicted protein [Plenodomus lingam JN3]CBX96144.1 predicted protein [Plenodomus lingam JN3]
MLASILVHYLEKETTTLYSRFSSQARHKSCDRPLGSWDAKTMCELAQGESTVWNPIGWLSTKYSCLLYSVL